MENECIPSSSKPLDDNIDDFLEYEPEPIKKIQKAINQSAGAIKLQKWLNRTLKIEMTDKRILIGIFLCTDRDANIILGSCSEYLPAEEDGTPTDDPRMLGLVMVPGKHIVNVSVDQIEMEYYNKSDDSVV